MGLLSKFAKLAVLGLVGVTVWKSGIALRFVDNNYLPERQFRTSQDFGAPTDSKTLQVIASDFTVNSESWDGASGVGGMMGPLFASVGLASPPDLIPCLVTLSAGRPFCAIIQRGGQIQSYCMNARDCDWQISVPSTGPFAFVLFDLDTGLFEGPWDYVDAIIVSDDPDSTEVRRLDRAVRRLVSALAPTSMTLSLGPRRYEVVFDGGESLRREKALVVISPRDLTSGYPLAQSSIRM
jgi:hypothetical protein